LLHGLKEAPELFRMVIPFTGANLVTRRATETVAEVMLSLPIHSASSLYWPSRPAGIYPDKSAPADNQCLLPDGLRPALPKALLPRDRQTAPDIIIFVLHPSRASL
jgi:hypothetical protein